MNQHRASWAAALIALAVGPPAAALDYQIHGFAAQGFALSEGNNVIGASTDGNEQYFELGVNGTAELGYGLRLSAQELVRRAGELDDGDVRLDYGFLDFQPVGGAAFDAGLRLGRVKNPFGLYNETRDIVFTRPSILLPLSVYFDTSGARSLLFSADGAQAYAGWSHGDQYSSLVVTRALDFDASRDEKRIFTAGLPFPMYGDLRFEDFLVARLMNDWSAGVFKLAASYMTATIAYDSPPSDPVQLAAEIQFDLYVLSAHYNAEHFSLASEYQLTRSRGNFGAPIEMESDGAYVQADYRFAQGWSVMARYDASFTDRGDRGGDECVDDSGAADRHACFTFDTMAGLKWLPDEHWGVWTEYHLFDGHSAVPTIENLGRDKDAHWNLFLLMGAYRF